MEDKFGLFTLKISDVELIIQKLGLIEEELSQIYSKSLDMVVTG